MPENGTTDIKVQLAGLKKDIENLLSHIQDEIQQEDLHTKPN